MNIPDRSFLLVAKDNLLEKSIAFDKPSIILGRNIKIFVGKLLPYKVFKGKKRMVVFLGDFYDPDSSEKNNQEVMESIYDPNLGFPEMLEKTYSLFGKWVIIEESEGNTRLMGDCCCTKSIKYHQSNLIVSDLASLVAYISKDRSAFELSVSDPHHQFAIKDFRKTCWWCGNATLYENVFSLLPNHWLEYLNHQDEEAHCYRKIISKGDKIVDEPNYLEYCYSRSVDLLSGFIKALSLREPFSLTLTGGKDSRILFSASHSQKARAHYFISVHGKMTENDKDVMTAKKLTDALNCSFKVYRTKIIPSIEERIKQFFPDIPAAVYAEYFYASNFQDIPVESKIVQGLIPEIISGYYYNRLIKLSGKGLADLARHGGSAFAEQKFTEWLAKAKKATLPSGYTVLDLFYWEHRGGRWGAQTVNVCELFQDLVWGFNCREFVDIWLKTDVELRRYPERNNLKELTKRFGREYLSVKYKTPSSCCAEVIYFLEKNKLSLPFRELDYLYRRIKRKGEALFGSKRNVRF